MSAVRVRNGDLGSALDKLRRQYGDTMKEAKRRRHHESPSVKRRNKMLANKRKRKQK